MNNWMLSCTQFVLEVVTGFYHHVIPYRFYPVSAGHGGGTILEGSEFARYCLHQTLSIDSEEMGVSLSEMVEDWLEAGSRE